MAGWLIGVGVGWLLGGVASLVTLIVAIYEIKPRVKKSTTTLRYIDYAENQLVEGKEHIISWGHIIPKKISLPKIHRNSEFHVLYKPQTSYGKELSKDYYEEKRKGPMQVITLIDKHIFDEAETDRVYMETKTPMEDENYKEKIKYRFQQDCIEIINGTNEEIRNIPLSLPSDIDISRLKDAMKFLTGFENPPEGSAEGIKIKIKKIPVNHGITPEILMIPISPA